MTDEIPTSSATHHALLAYFGPRNPSWKRILVIGQEANSDRPVGNHLDVYDLPRIGKENKVPFWTGSHKAVQRAAGFPGLSLRELAIAVGSSPLLYADASPNSISVATGRLRPDVTEGDLMTHALRLFALPEVRACRVIIISGRKAKWNAFYHAAQTELAQTGSVIAWVPFYGQGPASTEERYLPLCEPEIHSRIRESLMEWAAGNRIGLK